MALSDDLKAAHIDIWERAVNHQFVKELGSGALSRERFTRYFLQDYLFVDELRKVAGLAIAKAPDVELAREWGRFLAVLLGAEDALFRRAFADVGVSEASYRSAGYLPTTRAFTDFLVRVAFEGTFEDICCALYVTEGVYLDWATRLKTAGARPKVPLYEEWINIHDEKALGPFVAFLKGVVDRAHPSDAARRRLDQIFATTVQYELDFWDMAYRGEKPT
ncbi:MAG: TenA family protein [Chloroflexi bacterium]|nr:TenA family protein [Chloroflexota bacterium]